MDSNSNKGNDGEDEDKGKRSTKTSSTSASGSVVGSPAPPPTTTTTVTSSSGGENQNSPTVRTSQRQQHPQPPTTHTSQQQQQQQQHGASNEGGEEEDWRTVLEETVGKPGREALHSFFYPPVRHSMAEEEHQLGSSAFNLTSAITASGANHDAMNRSLGGGSNRGNGGNAASPSPRRRKQRRPMEQSDTVENHPQSSAVLASSAEGTTAAATTTTTTQGSGLASSTRAATQQDYPLEESSAAAAEAASTTEQFQDEDEGEPQQQHSQHPNQNNATQIFDDHFYQQAVEDRRFVEHFWQIYDDIIILSLFTQVGIVARLGVSTWFTYFDNVFSNGSPLFVNLPLNCLSCWLMGFFSSGERLMEIITTRFSPPQLQQKIHNESLQDSDREDHDDVSEEEELVHRRRKAKSSRKGRLRLSMHDNGGNSADDDDDDDDDDGRLGLGNGYSAASHSSSDDDDNDDGLYAASPESAATGRGGLFSRNARQRRKRRRDRRRRRRRRRKRDKSGGIDGAGGATNGGWFHSWQPPVHLNEELRDVQLLALERRIRLSKCLVLFPVKKADVDVMEHYFQHGYKKEHEDMNASNHEDNEFNGYGVHHHGSGHDTGGLDDLVLEESIDIDSAMVAPNTKRKSTSRESVGKNGPAAAAAASADPSTTTGGSSTNSKMETSSKPAVDPLTGTLPSQDDIAANNMSTADTDDTSPAENGEQRANSTTLYGDEPAQDLNQMVHDVQHNVTENISRLRRVNIADGWDVGTTPEAMSDDLMLGLRDGFCGALSSFSSWNSAMVNLLRGGNIGSALVGYVLGIQLPIIAYRFGQHVAVFFFIWRCRRETKRDERRGYGIRVSMNEFSEDRNSEVYRSGSIHGSLEMVDTAGSGDMVPDADGHSSNQTSPQHSMGGGAGAGAGGAYELPTETNHVERETPSIRAVATALFIIALVTQCTSISFYTDYESQVVALSLLFSPLGVLARWRLSKYNSWRQTFPVGTFASNILACALSGGLGRLLAGNPDERERLVLVSFINGFGGTLSSVAAFIVEILAGVDPVLLRLDGIIYALLSIFWAMVVGFVFSASADWADATE